MSSLLASDGPPSHSPPLKPSASSSPSPSRPALSSLTVQQLVQRDNTAPSLPPPSPSTSPPLPSLPPLPPPSSALSLPTASLSTWSSDKENAPIGAALPSSVEKRRADGDYPLSLSKKARSSPVPSPSSPSSASPDSSPLHPPVPLRSSPSSSSPVPPSLLCDERLSPELLHPQSSVASVPSTPQAMAALQSAYSALLDKAYALSHELAQAQEWQLNARTWMEAMELQLQTPLHSSPHPPPPSPSPPEATVPLSVHLSSVERLLERRYEAGRVAEEQRLAFFDLFDERLRAKDAEVQRLEGAHEAERLRWGRQRQQLELRSHSLQAQLSRKDG